MLMCFGIVDSHHVVLPAVLTAEIRFLGEIYFKGKKKNAVILKIGRFVNVDSAVIISIALSCSHC